MTLISPCTAKSHFELAREWDRLAEERHRQIASGEDLSFDNVVVPMVWRLFKDVDPSIVLDIGAGTGEFTLKLAAISGKVIAIDPSHVSMAVARKNSRNVHNVQYIESSLEDVAGIYNEGRATAAVAVMTLMTTPDLPGFTKSLGALLQKGGRFIATLTHPCFWPRYRGYEKEPWFSYDRETFIEAPFVISKCHTEIRTTHIHRPLEQYVNVFVQEGFRLESLAEPIPPRQLQEAYPMPWQFPRFLGLRWEKII